MQNAVEDWDDLRYLLCVQRGASFQAAGLALRVATSTVSRRVEALEARLGTRLVERSAQGVTLTPEGRRLATLAQEIEARLEVGSRDLDDADEQLRGRIRVSVGEGFVPLLIDAIAGFRLEHPEVWIDLLVEDRLVNLVRREADLGLRTLRPTSQAVTARRLGELGYGLYASEGYLREHPAARSSRDLAEQQVLGFDGPLAQLPWMGWLHEAGVKHFVLRTRSFSALLAAVVAGLGLSALPHAAAVLEPNLRRLLPDVELPAVAVWLAMHRDLRRVKRMRLFSEHLAQTFTRTLARRTRRR
jgi:DNA-binding transcriptional LysR family regulator